MAIPRGALTSTAMTAISILVLMTLVDQVSQSNASELVTLAQLDDMLDGGADPWKTVFACCIERLSRQDFLDIGFD